MTRRNFVAALLGIVLGAWVACATLAFAGGGAFVILPGDTLTADVIGSFDDEPALDAAIARGEIEVDPEYADLHLPLAGPPAECEVGWLYLHAPDEFTQNIYTCVAADTWERMRVCPVGEWSDDDQACVLDLRIMRDEPQPERLIVRVTAACYVPQQPIPIERTTDVVFAQEFEIPDCP